MKKKGQQSVNQYRMVLDYYTVMSKKILPQSVTAVDAVFIVPLFVFVSTQARQVATRLAAVSAAALYFPASHAVQASVAIGPQYPLSHTN